MSARTRRIWGLDGCVPVSPRAANFLLAQFDDHSARMRAQARDPEIYSVLLALREAALEWASSEGSVPEVPARDRSPEPTSESKKTTEMVTTSKAAELLGITDRAIRKAIQEDRLTAVVQDNGHYLISRTEIGHYRARTR